MNEIRTIGLTQQLDSALAQAAKRVRDRLAEANVGEFHLDIKIQGRTQGSEPSKLTYKLSQYGYDSSVEGNNLDSVIAEMLRRKGWTQANAPAQITFAGELSEASGIYKSLDEEIPF